MLVPSLVTVISFMFSGCFRYSVIINHSLYSLAQHEDKLPLTALILGPLSYNPIIPLLWWPLGHMALRDAITFTCTYRTSLENTWPLLVIPFRMSFTMCQLAREEVEVYNCPFAIFKASCCQVQSIHLSVARFPITFPNTLQWSWSLGILLVSGGLPDWVL